MLNTIENGARCGWCLTGRCYNCLSSGDGWVCECKCDKKEGESNEPHENRSN